MDLKGKKVIVLGLGDTGLSMAKWLHRQGAHVAAADSRAEPPRAGDLARALPGVAIELGEFREDNLRGADLIALSPGIDARTPAIAAAIRGGMPVTGDIELFSQALGLRARRPAIIAVTGTNGKSTVTHMAGDICAASGQRTLVAGNIGTPVLDALTQIEQGSADEPEIVVLELSSFQLETTATLAPDAATMLNLSEDHLDRYEGMADYAAAKARVFLGEGTQVLNRDDRASLAMTLPGRLQSTFALDAPAGPREWGLIADDGERWLARGGERLLAARELPLAGLHNAANALAAGALCQAIGVGDAVFARAARSFRGLPHRLEHVAAREGVDFYDDSKGTNVGAAAAALEGFTRPVVLIAGGDGKQQDFSPLREPVKRRARAVVLIGRDAGLLAAALDGSGIPLHRAIDMDEAVRVAYALTRPGDAVLLSPACASYDMFRSYVHRGQVFAASARKLAQHG